ncbi:hypothetical protein [Geopsychrobacter electrodiphilus]|uniref:hypothetical protein n=1 Tax=Geopsychrobacter electrodiphilus TaxID=225196 RepID=UPI000360B73A|nr:hypothetical protein [Geopsychrobacter electrodiphilus]
MFKLTRWFLWGLFSLLLLTILDQVLLRVNLPVPGYTEVHEFYIDFRSRLIELVDKDPVARVISTNKSEKSEQVKKTISTNTKQKTQRYLYVDAEGALQFADSLEQVPLQYRRDAQPMSE